MAGEPVGIALEPEIARLALRFRINEQILREAVAHAVYLERLKAHEANQVVGFLNEQVFPDVLGTLVARLERVARGKVERLGTGLWSTERYKDMVRAIKDVVRAGMLDAYKRLGEGLDDLAMSEAEWAATRLDANMVRGGAQDLVEFHATLPAPGLLRSIVRERPFEGHVLKEFWGSLMDKAQEHLVGAVNLGLAAGETIPQITRRVRGTEEAGFADGELERIRRGAAALARTAVTHVSAAAREDTYRENQDVVKGVLWVSTLDARTTPTCQTLDGKVFPVGEGQRPPAHYGCRSTTTPILKSWKELGISLREAPAGTRASMNGQVPAKLTYQEWLEDQPRQVQDDVLGPTRGELFRERRLRVQDFVDERYRPMTLKEIRAREGLTEELGRYQLANPEGADTLERFTGKDGLLTPERQALHDEIVARALGSARPSAERVVLWMGGGPASGKSSILKLTTTGGLDEAKLAGLSPTQVDVLRRMDAGDGTIRRLPGGLWTTPATPMIPGTLRVDVEVRGELAQQELQRPSWFVDARTMRALEDRGLVQATRLRSAAGRQVAEEYQIDASARGDQEPVLKIPEGAVTIDPDAIKALLPEYVRMLAGKDPRAAAYVHEESSLLSKRIMREAAKRGLDTVFDGTGDGSLDGLRKKLGEVRGSGAKVVAHYVTIDIDEALRRNEERAKKSGRLPPPEFVREVHRAISDVLPKAIGEGLFDEITVWDNNGEQPIAIAFARGPALEIRDEALWNRFVSKADPSYLPGGGRKLLEEMAPKIEELQRARRETDVRLSKQRARLEEMWREAPVETPDYDALKGYVEDAVASLAGLRNRERTIFHAPLAQSDHATIDLAFEQPPSAAFEAQALEAKRFVESLVRRQHVPGWPVQVKLIEGRRAFANPGEINVRERSVTLENYEGPDKPSARDEANVKVIVHELGHTFEFSDWRVLEAAERFLKRRAAADPRGLQNLSEIEEGRGYALWEEAWADKFVESYMGKFYGERQGSEIVSMGLEYLWSDPMKLYRLDPEYFAFMVDLLRGVGLPPRGSR